MASIFFSFVTSLSGRRRWHAAGCCLFVKTVEEEKVLDQMTEV
jgi:hypothetical protein